MATKKYVVTLEVECDPDEVQGLPLNHPACWNYNALLRAGGYNVWADAKQVYEACCDGYINWVSTPEDERFIKKFDAFFHDEDCVNFVDIDEE